MLGKIHNNKLIFEICLYHIAKSQMHLTLYIQNFLLIFLTISIFLKVKKG